MSQINKKYSSLDDEEDALRKYLYDKGLSDKEIAEKVGVSRPTINEWRKRRRLECNHSTRPVNDNFFNKINSGAKTYIIGFWIGDGFARRDSGHCIGFRQDEKNILMKIKNIMNSEHSIYERTDGYELHIYSKKLFNGLSSHFDESITEGITQIPEFKEDFKNDFLRGLFDADGCISLDKKKHSSQVQFSISGKKVLLENSKEILQGSLNLNNVSVSKGNKTYQLKYSGNEQVPRIMNYLYKGSSIFLEWKRNKWVNLKRKYCKI